MRRSYCDVAAVASCQAASLDMAVAFVAPVVAKQEARRLHLNAFLSHWLVFKLPWWQLDGLQDSLC